MNTNLLQLLVLRLAPPHPPSCPSASLHSSVQLLRVPPVLRPAPPRPSASSVQPLRVLHPAPPGPSSPLSGSSASLQSGSSDL